MPWVSMIFGCMSGSVALFSLYLVAKEILRYSRVKTWPRVLGRVSSSEVIKDHDSDGNTHRVGIDYEYSVGGSTYRGQERPMNVGRGNDTRAREIIALYPAQFEVLVAYDPGHPDKGLLADPLRDRIQLGTIIPAIGCIVIFIMWAVYWIVTSNNVSPP